MRTLPSFLTRFILTLSCAAVISHICQTPLGAALCGAAVLVLLLVAPPT